MLFIYTSRNCRLNSHPQSVIPTWRLCKRSMEYREVNQGIWGQEEVRNNWSNDVQFSCKAKNKDCYERHYPMALRTTKYKIFYKHPYFLMYSKKKHFVLSLQTKVFIFMVSHLVSYLLTVRKPNFQFSVLKVSILPYAPRLLLRKHYILKVIELFLSHHGLIKQSTI